jgi:hypothetical protein
MTFTVVSLDPVITSLNPSSAKLGDYVTISGTGFGANWGTSTVTFNGTGASVRFWAATNLVVMVPYGATTGNVVVTVNGVASNGMAFTVVYPIITSLNPTFGQVGDTVTISGTGFGAVNYTVTFNGTNASISSWSDTSIVVTIPIGATTGNVVVSLNGIDSNKVWFYAGPCQQTVMYEGREWQKCTYGERFGQDGAKAFCDALIEGGHDDWTLPSIETLRSLIVCSNGTQVTFGPDAPRYDDKGDLINPMACWDGNSAPYTSPTIDPVFIFEWTSLYWSSTPLWLVSFGDGRVFSDNGGVYARCVRGGP